MTPSDQPSVLSRASVQQETNSTSDNKAGLSISNRIMTEMMTLADKIVAYNIF